MIHSTLCPSLLSAFFPNKPSSKRTNQIIVQPESHENQGATRTRNPCELENHENQGATTTRKPQDAENDENQRTTRSREPENHESHENNGINANPKLQYKIIANHILISFVCF